MGEARRWRAFPCPHIANRVFTHLSRDLGAERIPHPEVSLVHRGVALGGLCFSLAGAHENVHIVDFALDKLKRIRDVLNPTKRKLLPSIGHKALHTAGQHTTDDRAPVCGSLRRMVVDTGVNEGEGGWAAVWCAPTT